MLYIIDAVDFFFINSHITEISAPKLNNTSMRHFEVSVNSVEKIHVKYLDSQF